MKKFLTRTYELTPDDLKQLITDYVSKQLDVPATHEREVNIEFDVQKSIEGYGMMEMEVVKFYGAKVTVKERK